MTDTPTPQPTPATDEQIARPSRTTDGECEPGCISWFLHGLRTDPAHDSHPEGSSGLATDDLVVDRDSARHFADEVDKLRAEIARLTAITGPSLPCCGRTCVEHVYDNDPNVPLIWCPDDTNPAIIARPENEIAAMLLAWREKRGRG